MPSIRIPFPEKEQPALVVLRSNRITIGRSPDNAIQIPDRTVSGHHAELIADNGHYRVHDLGATNGIQVNGQVVTDFQLTEGCKVSFGTVECEFSPEVPANEEADPSKALVTRAEAEGLKQEIASLQSQVAAFRQEAETLRADHAAKEGEATVSQAEFDRVTNELSGMTLKLVEAERQIADLKSQMGVLSRDRANLQRALGETKTKPTSAATAAQAEEPTPEPAPIAAEAPMQDVVAEAEAAPSPEDQKESEPAVPAAPSPAQTMPPPRPKPLFVPGAGSQPGGVPAKPVPAVAAPRAPGQLQPAAASKGPGMSGTGLRPASFAKPAPGAPTAPGAPMAKPGAPTFQGKPGLAAKAGIPTKPMAAIPKAVPAGAKPVATPAGPKGTQKLS